MRMSLSYCIMDYLHEVKIFMNFINDVDLTTRENLCWAVSKV